MKKGRHREEHVSVTFGKLQTGRKLFYKLHEACVSYAFNMNREHGHFSSRKWTYVTWPTRSGANIFCHTRVLN